MEVYQLIGEVNVPEDRKCELNHYVMELLYRTGIRKTEEICLDGQRHTVVSRAIPDQNGIVRFDYSIFEKRAREIASYDLNTCQIHVPDAGRDEFCISAVLVMMLLEEYSDGSCYLMREGKSGVSPYTSLDLLYSILGKKFYLRHRGRVWEMMLFFHQHHIETNKLNIIRMLPFDISPVDIEQMLTVLLLHMDDLDFSKPDILLNREQIPSASSGPRNTYMHWVMKRMEEENTGKLFPYVKELLGKDLEARREAAKRDDDFGVIAELSIYIDAPMMLSSCCRVCGMDFWETWDLLETEPYNDSLQEDRWSYVEDDREWGFPFYRAIMRDNEDDFLEFWDGREMELSAEMKENMEKWKQVYGKMDMKSNPDMEKCLGDILGRLNSDWRCRYMDITVVKEFLANKDDPSYQNAVALCSYLMDENCRMFPELTLRQARIMARRGNQAIYKKKELDAYLSMLANPGLRQEILGF